MQANWKPYRLHFIQPATTSRGTLAEKLSYFLTLATADGAWGMGECSILPGLSPDQRPGLTAQLTQICQTLQMGGTVPAADLSAWPALQFGLEMAQQGLNARDGVWFPSAFTEGQHSLPINGLIWMADKRTMQTQIRHKLAQGFRCVKLKIGALAFAEEYALLQAVRREYHAAELEIRVDANGAFHPDTALQRLQQLATLELHSIEQPIAPGQATAMAQLTAQTPLPIALDEELIGIVGKAAKQTLLDTIRPHYIILKPSLLGGLAQAQQWIELAQARHIGWWVTSALESNLGLNVLAQWTATLGNPLAQGLGTGLLYDNNVPSPLHIENGYLSYISGFDPQHYQDFFAHV
jgi:o-succinylbenzoate synthase